MKPDTYYQILEIEPGSSQAEIKQAYKDLAKVWHPDRFSDNPRLQQKAEEKLKRINAAYEFLKSYQPQVASRSAEQKQEQSIDIVLDCKKLENLIKLGRLKEADHETKRLLLKLAGREKDGWLRSEDIQGLTAQSLIAIDQIWHQYSNGHFGFSVQGKIWHQLSCTSSGDIPTQTVSENKFGRSVGWRVGNVWLSPWDSFNYSLQAPQGSLPREYIFTLNGWRCYSKGWTGYLLLRFDDIFLKL